MIKNIEIKIDESQYLLKIGRELDFEIIKIIKEMTPSLKVLLVTDKYFSIRKAKIISDKFIANGFDCHIFEMSGGKNSKSFFELMSIYGILEANNFSRDSTLIALGGGVVGDLGGFAASTWYRGMNLIHMPTSLMAMVDSSVGGKVAINFRDTINAVGGYYHPILNLMDLEIIDTLSQRDYLSGLAEVIKCALIFDQNLFEWLKKNADCIKLRHTDHLIYCIEQAIQIKVNHVDGDLKETGKRLHLNYGHTLGHAIEMATQTEQGETFRHGEGVAIGMVGAMHIANDFLNIPQKETQQVIEILEKFNLPVSVSASELGFERQSLIDLCFSLTARDKKRKANNLRFILLEKIGKAKVYTDIPSEIVKNALSKIIVE